MKIFQKDLRKEYLKMTGIKYGKEEEKEIKSMLKSEMPLEIFKLCVTPMIDERKLKEIGNSHIELKKISETDTLIYLKAEQMKELKRGYETGLTYEEIELYKKADLTSKDMQKARENIQEDTDGDGKSDQEEVKIEKSNPRDAEKEIENNSGLKEYKEKKKKKEKEFER